MNDGIGRTASAKKDVLSEIKQDLHYCIDLYHISPSKIEEAAKGAQEVIDKLSRNFPKADINEIIILYKKTAIKRLERDPKITQFLPILVEKQITSMLKKQYSGIEQKAVESGPTTQYSF